MTSLDVSVRSATVADAAEMARLSGVLGYTATPADFKPRLSAALGDERQRVMVSPLGGSGLAGWVHAVRQIILESGPRTEILGLVVDPRARRRGVGAALVRAVESWASETEFHRLVVRSNVVRDEAHRFYPALGYRKIKSQAVYRKVLTRSPGSAG